MRTCDFNKVGLLLFRNHTSAWVSPPVYLLHICRTHLLKNTWETASEFVIIKLVKMIFKSL